MLTSEIDEIKILQERLNAELEKEHKELNRLTEQLKNLYRNATIVFTILCAVSCLLIVFFGSEIGIGTVAMLAWDIAFSGYQSLRYFRKWLDT